MERTSLNIKNTKILLIILDGWGINPNTVGNAVAMGKTPVFDRLKKDYPYTELVASGSAIDLPPGRMGNSEVGHQNIGAGRVVPQASTMITRSIASGKFFDNRRLLSKVMKEAKAREATVHLFGLLSDGLVHSHIDHAFALLKLANQFDLNCIVHPLLDGRDVPPKSAKKYINKIEGVMSELNMGKIGTITGRVLYERDHKKWQHVEGLYNLLVHNKGSAASSAVAAVDDAYTQGITIDEHIPPYFIVNDKNKPVSQVRDGDVFINWNFRGDRATMISHALVDKEFNYFNRGKHPKIDYICMSLYDDDIPAPVAYPPVKLRSILSEVLCQHGLRQFKTAETTKFYHLTFFFNCRRKRPFPCEVQTMVPSKKTRYYDEEPEMSASEVAESIIDALDSQQFESLAVNFANPDMVGHTGNLEAAIKAVEFVDHNLGRVINVAQKRKYSVIVTADHGNADQMIDYETGKPHTAHTSNNVPFILILDPDATCYRKSLKLRDDGLLGNIAPTILELFDIPKPAEMSCKSLLI
jgi:2,3-bisphosphoglycerate-independent phosphoglycerate mutase